MMTPTIGNIANDTMAQTEITVPPMSMPQRPNRSSRAPANTRMSVAATVMTVVARPTIWPVAPSCAMYTGNPIFSIWKPKNMLRLMVDSMRKSRVNISPSDSLCGLGLCLPA